MKTTNKWVGFALTAAVSAIAAIWVAGVGGCQVSPPIQGRQDPYARPQVTFTDPYIARHTAMDAPVVTRDAAGDILLITLPIRSTTDRDMFLEYRVTFFDSAGQVLNQTTWLPKSLQPNVPDQIAVNSLSGKAASFQIDFRQAK